MESLAPITRTSAQETIPGQTFSTASLISLRISSPPIPSFAGAFCSVLGPSRNIDASHPYYIESN